MSQPRLTAIRSCIQKLAAPPAGGQPDGELLRRFARHRDEAAFTALVRRHGPMVFQVCRRNFHGWHDAEDACQAVFLVLAAKAGSRHWRGSVAPWLFRVAYHLALRARTAAARRQAHEARVLPRVPADLDHEITGRELRAVLDDELVRLPVKYGAPLVLCYLEGATRDEAARQLGWPLGTLKSRVERGRELLHRRLVARGLTLPSALSAALLADGAARAGVGTGLAARVIELAPRLTAGLAARANGPALCAVTLAQGMLRSFLVQKVKLIAFWLAASCLLASGLSLTAFSPWASEQARRQENGTPQGAPAAGVPPVLPPPQERTDAFGDLLPKRALFRLGTLRLRQGSTANAVTFTADGKTLVSAGYTGQIHFWDAATGKKLRSLPVPQPAASCLALSADDRYLAAGTPAGIVYVWDCGAGKLLWTLQTEGKEVRCLAFAPRGTTLAASGGEWGRPGVVQLWDAATGQALHRLEGHGKPVLALAFAPGGKLLATAGYDDDIHLWDPERGTRLRLLPDPEGHGRAGRRIHSLAFLPDGETVACGSGEQGLYLLDAATGKVRHRLTGHAKPVTALAVAPRTGLLASAGSDGTARLWDPAQGKALRTLRGTVAPMTYQEVRSLAITPDGQTVAAALRSGALVLHRVATGEELFADRGHPGMVQAVAVSPDGATLVTGGSDGTVRFWDRASGKALRRFDTGDATGLQALAWSPDARLLAAVTGSRRVPVWEAATGQLVHEFHGRSMAFAPDGKTLAVGGARGATRWGDSIELRELGAGRTIRAWRGDDTAVGSIAFSPDGKLLASAGWNPRYGTALDSVPFRPASASNLVRLWDVATGGERLRFGDQELGVRDLAFSPDGRMVAAVPGDVAAWSGSAPPVRVWEVATAKERGRYSFHAGTIQAARFSPDGSVLATASNDFTTCLINLENGKPHHHVFHDGPVYAVAFTPDGRNLLAGSMATTALVSDVSHLVRQRPEAQPPLSAPDLERLWTDLAEEDAAAAYRAVWALRRRPQEAVQTLRRHLRPAAATDVRRLHQLLADLDSEQFTVREQSSREVRAMGEAAAPAIGEALAGKLSPEARRRLEQLRDGLQGASPPAETRREVRAVEVLENLDLPEARQFLEALARGATASRLTQEAKAALSRRGTEP